MKKYISIALLTLVLVGCSPLQKAMKSDDIAYKREVAQKLYEEKKYRKALRLYEQMERVGRGTPDAEQMFFNFANASYIVKDYMLAKERFKLFAAAYPKSERHEEALLLEIKSTFALSPVYSLDQGFTHATIAKLQEFIDAYPASEHAVEANQLMTKASQKLEKKTFEIAKQLNTIGGWTRDYTASIIALDNFIFEYPGTIYKEDALYYKFDSAYNLAINSVYSKMEERLENAKTMYDALIRFKADTKYKNQADRMLERVTNDLQQFSK
ncbi:outer membrane protein assembly factor BamD [Flavobacterium sp. JP2137]|uniref:outer membrane protein assembly factor BamD n=1 Tax=Flavobacterium sp. JP2137 TaxID=3414510 RepID=UPI003D2FAFB2